MAPSNIPKTPMAITTANLDELISLLYSCGVSVQSPHQRMVEEAAAAAAEAEAEAAAAAEAEAAAASAASNPQDDNPPELAQSSSSQALSHELVVQALAALGVDVSGVASLPSPATFGGPVHASTSFGGGGTTTMTSTGVHAATQPLDKGKGVLPPVGAASSSGSIAADHSARGIRCPKCNYWMAPPATSTTISPPTAWYIVTVGLDVGIYTDWHVASPLVTSVSGAVFKKYNSREVADAKFNEALDEGRVRRVAP